MCDTCVPDLFQQKSILMAIVVMRWIWWTCPYFTHKDIISNHGWLMQPYMDVYLNVEVQCPCARVYVFNCRHDRKETSTGWDGGAASFTSTTTINYSNTSLHSVGVTCIKTLLLPDDKICHQRTSYKWRLCVKHDCRVVLWLHKTQTTKTAWSTRVKCMHVSVFRRQTEQEI